MILQTPLIKCKAEFSDSTDLIGFASGKRSAIIVDSARGSTDDTSFIRLKGCGNLDQGFPLEPMAWPPGISEEVRGCQFSNTVFREMYYQKLVNEMLESEKLTGANIPLGIWQYGQFEVEQSRNVAAHDPRVGPQHLAEAHSNDA